MRRYIVITFLAVLLAAASVALLRKGKGMENNSAWNPERLSELYDQMLANYESGEIWKNIPGAKEILSIMKDVAPERDEEINPAVRMLICERIIAGDLIDVRDTPRLYLEYLEYWMECRDMPKTEDDLKDVNLE